MSTSSQAAGAASIKPCTPERVCTADGCVWVRRAVDSDGAGRYAPAAVSAECPTWVLASWQEVLHLGVAATGGAGAEQRHLLDPAVPPAGYATAAVTA